MFRIPVLELAIVSAMWLSVTSVFTSVTDPSTNWSEVPQLRMSEFRNANRYTDEDELERCEGAEPFTF